MNFLLIFLVFFWKNEKYLDSGGFENYLFILLIQSSFKNEE
tara:strand:+ start:1070 stop:1192 length:123 start_codon:yes stop_codon:yes gene_type:complete